LLLTTIAASAPVSRLSSGARWSWREPRDPVERRLRQRRAAEIGVHEHAGRVEDAAERRPPCCR